LKTEVQQMKWWGWGVEGSQFNISDKPELWPFVDDILGINGEVQSTLPVSFDSITMPEQTLNQAFLDLMTDELGQEYCFTDKKERLIHAYGKSFRDLWRIRHGIVAAAPDCVVYPESELDVVTIVRAAQQHDVVIIPFGGGSNIAGCLDAQGNGRMVVSLDMKRMNRVLEVDKTSNTAHIQSGALGPEMEVQLNAEGVTLGHFPDSFEYSTLGGWIATRSAGMQSDKYGKIEDMVVALRMVTPSGTIVTRKVPKASNGIDINHICIGSEGILGVITEATMQVHQLPECRAFYGYIFPDFESGIAAVQECVEQDCAPVITRLNDAGKTALSFAYKSKSSGLKSLLSKLLKWYLRAIKKYDLSRICLMLTAFEGTKTNYKQQKKMVNTIYKKHGGINLGTEPGKTFERGKYDFPYLRDYVMDRNIMADVSETATVWSNILPLYYKSYKAIEAAIRETGYKPFVGCHISHTYHTGASLYFTFGCLQKSELELEQYLYIKKAAEDAFIQNGGSLSHHHAVGTEHLPWIEEDISATGIKAVQALKDGLDPASVMNPGKIISNDYSMEKWGLSAHAMSSLKNKVYPKKVSKPSAEEASRA